MTGMSGIGPMGGYGGGGFSGIGGAGGGMFGGGAGWSSLGGLMRGGDSQFSQSMGSLLGGVADGLGGGATGGFGGFGGGAMDGAGGRGGSNGKNGFAQPSGGKNSPAIGGQNSPATGGKVEGGEEQMPTLNVGRPRFGGQPAISLNFGGMKINVSPVAVDLNGDGKISTTGDSTAKDRAAGSETGETVSFDMNNDGRAESIEWMSGDGDGLLVDNSDGNAANDMNGSRLFGDERGKYGSGYEKLAERDANGDGQLTGAELDGMQVWVDNGDAKVQNGELQNLSDHGIESVSVQRNDVQNDRGETLMQSTAEKADGTSILTEDVWFAPKV